MVKRYANIISTTKKEITNTYQRLSCLSERISEEGSKIAT